MTAPELVGHDDIDALITRLRLSQEQLSGERAGLLARNEQARSRVEAMIQRLKSLESNG